MIEFDNLINEIYLRMIDINNGELKPYYLILSSKNYGILRAELIKSGVYKDNRIEFFENMEVVELSYVPEDYLEIKGIKLI